MTSSRFEAQEGRLTLSVAGLGALPALVSGDASSLDMSVRDELERGGIITVGVLHDRLVPLARCVAVPRVRMTLDRVSGGAFHVDGWLDDRLAVLMRSVHGAETGDVVAIPRGMVSFRLAALVGLGPRPRVKVTDPVEVDEALLEALVAAGPGLTATQIASLLQNSEDMIPEWLSLLSALSQHDVSRWRAGTWWNSTEEAPAARALEVVESEPGSFVVLPRPRSDRFRRVALRPLTATQMWRLLCALIPSPQEVARPLDH